MRFTVVASPSIPSDGLQGAWDTLDRYAQALQAEVETAGQIRLSLEAVREGTRSDLVLWHPGTGSEPPLHAGRAEAAPERIARIARSLPLDGADSRLLRGVGIPGPAPGDPEAPAHVAMLRVSRTLGSWIVAIRFEPARPFRPVDLKVVSLARRLLLNHRYHLHVYERLRESLFGLVHCLTAAIDAKDPHTCGHSERVARIGQRIGVQMGLPGPLLNDLYLAGLLHDIGKIGVRDDILKKAGPLTTEEFAHVQAHPVIGERLVSSIHQLAHLRPGIRNHHERYDGQGYPDKLAGEAIPLMARVLAVADSCDAMMSDRPYRPGLPAARIERIMADGSGTQWDPAVVRAFMACRRDLYSTLQQGLGESVEAAVEHTLGVGMAGASVVSARGGVR
ncbi:HD-GYP domain-containing protein [Paludisphaera mucosa]|uniref:HD-GYP domain-containing protein n=1 Tax=Paludisphaera mucosa TaxID=3030827 RepID=A0ABT6FKL3_9BACT|nr:HD-GYP domain-containing protein [Paludisphaera mucosa]MDG3008079.1 HD-GYP domain-containing protein [Paludisphaera mucosa]